MKILIADDHPTNLKLLRAQLEAEGHEVLEVHDGVQALAVLERAPVDAIISDILMPNMDGFRLCREIRQSEKFRALPFILYTSTYDSPKDRELAKVVGSDDYVVKPAPASEIMAALHVAMLKPRERTDPVVSGPTEVYVLKQYSEALVHKLEVQNLALKLALEELRLTERKYRNVFERSIEGIFQSTPDGRYLMANPAMASILGFDSPEELIARRNDIARQCYADPAKREEFIRLMEVNGSVYGFEYQAYRKDGTAIWISENAQAVRDASGQLLCYEGTLLDITQRKQAEEALRKGEERFRRVIEDIFKFVPEPLLVFNRNLSLLKDNKAFEDLVRTYAPQLNYTEEEFSELLLNELRAKVLGGATGEIRIRPKNRDGKETREPDHSG